MTELYKLTPEQDTFAEAQIALLRRDWAVRVLDAWRDWSAGTVLQRDSAEVELFFFGSSVQCDAKYADRLAAAEAVWPELPESVRAELGERP